MPLALVLKLLDVVLHACQLVCEGLQSVVNARDLILYCLKHKSVRHVVLLALDGATSVTRLLIVWIGHVLFILASPLHLPVLHRQFQDELGRGEVLRRNDEGHVVFGEQLVAQALLVLVYFPALGAEHVAVALPLADFQLHDELGPLC